MTPKTTSEVYTTPDVEQRIALSYRINGKRKTRSLPNPSLTLLFLFSDVAIYRMSLLVNVLFCLVICLLPLLTHQLGKTGVVFPLSLQTTV